MRTLRLSMASLTVFALSLGAITGVGVLPAAADVVYPTIGEFSYRADNTAISAGATITGYTGAGGVVDIPASVDIDGTPYAVTAIGGDAFREKQVTEVTIPASVTTIGQSAFRENPLTTVALPASLTTLGGDAFRSNRLTTINIPTGVTAIGSTTFYNNLLTTVTIPRTVTTIGDFAFDSNLLTTVTIPSGVTTIGDSAFSGNQLTTVTIPSGVTTIGESAFYGNQLTTVTIPSGVTTIDDWAFARNDLTSVSIPSSVTTINYAAFTDNLLTTVTIPGRVTTIGQLAFAYNRLAKVTIPSSVTTIGDYAFDNNLLTTATIPSGVTTIGSYAFASNLLAKLTIPSSVTTIGDSAFQANRLTTVTLGTSVTTIGNSAFSDNTLTAISIPGSVDTIGNSAFTSNALATATIAPGVTTIGNNSFEENKLTTITIPDTVTTIGYSAFAGNDLRTVTIPDSVTTMRDAAFARNNLTSVTIPNSLTTISTFAFYLNDLRTVTVPSSVTTIGFAAFTNNISLTTVLFLGAPPTIYAENSPNPSFGEAASTTFYHLPAHASDFGETWNGYTTTAATPFTTTRTPDILGTVKVGHTLTAHVNKWSPTATLSYEWKHSDSSTVLGRNARYTPTTDDLGKNLIVTVTGYSEPRVASAETSAETAAVALGAFTPIPTPLISGTKQVGKILTVDPGDWPADTTFTYLWKRAGVALTGETSTQSRYTVVSGDLSKKLSVTVTATLPGYTDAIATSASTTAIVAGTFTLAPVPTISGTKQIGEPLTAVTGTWTSGATLAYAWKRSGSTAVIGRDARYTPVTADLAKTLTVTVTATRKGFTTLSKTSARTTAVIGLPFTTEAVPTITGSATAGSVLTAVTTGWEPNASVTFTYVWKRASTSGGTKTTIARATGKTYRLVTADKGKYLTVTVVAKKTGYASTTKTSADDGTKIAS